MTHLKICGIKGEAILPFLTQPVAYVGFIFHPPSHRFISVEVAKGLALQLAQNPKTRGIKKVGVFVDASDDFIMERAGVLDILQLHGNETPQRLSEIKALTAKPLIKALKVPKLGTVGDGTGGDAEPPTGKKASGSSTGSKDSSSTKGEGVGSSPTSGKGSSATSGGEEGAEGLAWLQAAIKSHSKVADYLMLDGGMGQGVPFDWRLCGQLSLPSGWFLAGGIDAGNIHLAQKTDAGVLDISSGVEDASGEKSPAKLTELIAKLKTVPEAELNTNSSTEPDGKGDSSGRVGGRGGVGAEIATGWEGESETDPEADLNSELNSEPNTESDTDPEAKTGFTAMALQ